MATRKSESKVKQTPILETENKVTNAPETDSCFENKTTPKQETFTKSRARTSLEEVAVTYNMRPEVKAGFKTWLNGEYFHFDEEWKELFEKYQNRTL